MDIKKWTYHADFPLMLDPARPRGERSSMRIRSSMYVKRTVQTASVTKFNHKHVTSLHDESTISEGCKKCSPEPS